MRRLLASLVLTGILVTAAHAQQPFSTQFTTGFAPKELRFVPIDTTKTMRQYSYNNPMFLSNTARRTGAFNLGNLLPRINLPGFGPTRVQTPFVPPSQNPYQRIFTPNQDQK